LRLGQYFAERGICFEAILIGTLRRHEQTLRGVLEGMGVQGEPLVWPGLNEYDSVALIEAVHPEPLPPPNTPEAYRHHFRLLRDGLTQWMAGVLTPRGMPSYAAFSAGVTGALDHVRTHHHGQSVLVVSSGGPISTMVGQVLRTPPESTIELNLRIRNTALTELAFTPKRHMLVSYNSLPHLDAPGLREWVTYT
jgi:broad specificity phosphatase PhoE